MVHAFRFEDLFLLYDGVSGSLNACDEAAFALARKKLGEDADLSAFSPAQLAEAESDLAALEADGTLFAREELPPFSTHAGAVKALCLHISHDCNLCCEYCFAGGGDYHGERGHMSFETARAAVDFLIARSGGISNLEMDFFGGEPLMNFGVVRQTVAYAKRRAKEAGKHFKFTLTTNGLLLDDEITDFLNEEMDNVVLSLDGRPEVHNRVRKTRNGKDSFDLIADKFLAFRQKRGDKSYYVRGTFTAENLDFSRDVLFLNDLGFDQISVEPVVLPPEHRLAIKREHLPRILAEYETLAKEYVRRRQTDKWFNFFHFMIDLNGGPCLSKRLTGCGAGGSYLSVTPSGKIYPCHQFAEEQDYCLGSVFRPEDLREDIRETFAASNLLTKPSCRECFAKYHCSGGCSANSVHLCGDINKPYEISCEMMKKRTELALGIYAFEHRAEFGL